MAYQPIEKLDALMGGAVQEKFRIALAEVLSNVRDPNTKASAKREITLKITLAPDEDRKHIEVSCTASSKLADPRRCQHGGFRQDEAGSFRPR